MNHHHTSEASPTSSVAGRTRHVGRRAPRRRTWHCAVAVCCTVGAVASIAGCDVGDGELTASPSAAGAESTVGAASTDPAAVIAEYRVAYNDGDIERVMSLFSDDSVINGHPFAGRSEGLDAIRALQIDDLASADPSDAYRIDHVDVVGDTATWSHVFTNAAGERWCGEENRAVVRNAKIVIWDFAPDRYPCP